MWDVTLWYHAVRQKGGYTTEESKELCTGTFERSRDRDEFLDGMSVHTIQLHRARSRRNNCTNIRQTTTIDVIQEHVLFARCYYIKWEIPTPCPIPSMYVYSGLRIMRGESSFLLPTPVPTPVPINIQDFRIEGISFDVPTSLNPYLRKTPSKDPTPSTHHRPGLTFHL